MRTGGIVAVLFGLAIGFFAPVPASGEEVLFVSDRDQTGNWDIYAIDVDTLVVRRLTTDPGIDNHPDCSEDGTKVVWSSSRTNGGANPERDFEIFVADDDGVSTGSLEAGSPTQLTSNDIPDRHPHFNHKTVAADMRIVYSAKYICVTTTTTTVSQCSIPAVVIINPCGRKCEGLRVTNIDGTSTIDIDHDDLTAANPTVWPQRKATDARWVGHPSFSHDDTRILFSGAVDGEGRNWEVYVADWNVVGGSVSNLRQVTRGSTYPSNDNPIRMSAGAHFTTGDANIIFTSTRTELGNSQLFQLPTTSNLVPVSAANRYPLTSDRANDYVPDLLMDGRVVVTSDRDEFMGILLGCGTPSAEYSTPLDTGDAHTIRVEVSGLTNSPSGGKRIHLDAYSFNWGASFIQESTNTTYSAGWSDHTSPNASDGHYQVAPGTGSEYVDITVPTGTGNIKLYLGQTLNSGVARIYIDGVPIVDGGVALPGDTGADMSGVDLYTPQLVTSNDLDLILIDPAGPTATNLTDNDLADEMSLIGDEVSWFCGLSPNLSLCTYLPKYFTIGQLGLMQGFGGFTFPTNFPSRDLYTIAMQALNQFMMSGGNGLRPQNIGYWQQIQNMVHMPGGIFNDELVVLPTPVNFHVDNRAPNMPADPVPADGTTNYSSTVVLGTSAPTDPDSGQVLTSDIYLASGTDGAFVLVGKDLLTPSTTVQSLPSGVYTWRADHKDSMGGRNYGPTWTFAVTSKCDLQQNFHVDADDFTVFQDCESGPAIQHNGSPICVQADFDGDTDVDQDDFAVWQRCYTGETIAADPNCAN